MKQRISGIFCCIVALFFTNVTFATHNRAGEITYRQTGPLSIEMTIITYTKASSTAADRDSLEVFWGDGTRQFVVRDDSRTRFEANDIKINHYTAPHTYPGVATYTISFQDPNRVGGILNVNYPNSIDIPFYLSTTFTLLDQQFQGYNNSAILLQPPIDIGCVNKLFIHNPNGYDIDGDSLAYELAAPLQGLNTPVPGYKLPDQIGPTAGNVLTINATTGEVRWKSPKLQGEYNIAIRIKEYRNGKLINVIFRDMQILIKACENEPPLIDAIDEICVVAGKKIVIPIRVNDVNSGQKVKLTATGGPFTLNGKAILSGPTYFSQVPFQASVVWQTQCNHISDQYYQIVLRAVDNFNPDSTGLATLKTIRIKVVGPSPEQLSVSTENGRMKLSWNKPYGCEVTTGNYFQGFSVWRKIASANFQPDTCNPGLTGSPYTKIAYRTTFNDGSNYIWYDTTAERGVTYCYRVQAEFARLTGSGNPFNRVESLPSNEACQILMRDLPLITRVSVLRTSVTQGSIFIRWTRPLAEELDTLENPGPYRAEIWRKEDTGPEFMIHSVSSPTFSGLTDTTFTDTSLNTSRQQFNYQVRFYSDGKITGKSASASSVFLKVSPSDRKNLLHWNAKTPWSNFQYNIYLVKTTGDLELIATTKDTSWLHSGLNNDSLYCYSVLATGTYSIAGIEDPLENWSQTVCQAPEDNVAPCTPIASVTNVCDQLTGKIPITELYNTVKWSVEAVSCGQVSDDIARFAIYYGETTESPLEKVAEVANDLIKTYIHYPVNGLLGCYAVSAIDSIGNESMLSDTVCVDNCPFYELPNTFTPNGDGYNDLFRPRINLFIHEIDLKVFNTWGNLVFSTSNPSIDWDGSSDGGKELSPGTYYYTCRIFENRVTGITEAPSPLQGFIHIIR